MPGVDDDYDYDDLISTLIAVYDYLHGFDH